MARPIWSGTLSFGLVSIPVGLHTAVRDLGPHFHLLRERDHSRIQYEKVAAADHKPVPKDQLVKGYEVEKGEFVEVTDEDFSKAALKKDRVINILDFVEADQIDDRYFDKPYYLDRSHGTPSEEPGCEEGTLDEASEDRTSARARWSEVAHATPARRLILLYL